MGKIILLEADVKRLQDIKTFIAENLDQELSAAMIADKFTMGKSTLRRHFSTYFGNTLYHFILQTRMEHAMSLLKRKASSINDIAIAVGYKEVSSFSRAFAKYYGQPPFYFLQQ